jgi:hypothetical protein
MYNCYLSDCYLVADKDGAVLCMPLHDALGLRVPSTAPIFLAFVGVHIAGGLTGVVTGAAAAFSPKRHGCHGTFGNVYFGGSCVLFATAVGLAAMRGPEDYNLVLIGAAAFGMALAGLVARERRWPGDATHIIGMAARMSQS